MKTYRIPCSWEMYGVLDIEAESYAAACRVADDGPLPDSAEYVTDSFRIDHEIGAEYAEEDHGETIIVEEE